MSVSRPALVSARINPHAFGSDKDDVARGVPNSSQGAAMRDQPALCLWLTGLSGAGKSTIAAGLERRLQGIGRHTTVLDGDALRAGLNRDLGFSPADRTENIRRIAEVARLMVEAGLIVVVAAISPCRDDRRRARERFAPGAFLEVFVDAPIEVCEQRDPKGLYRWARAGGIENFTGVSAPYERPLRPDITLLTAQTPSDALVERVLTLLRERGIIAA